MGPRFGRARRGDPPLAYGFRRGRRHLGPPNGAAFREATLEVDLDRREDTRGDPGFAVFHVGDPGARSAHEEGQRGVVQNNAQRTFSRVLRPVTCPVHERGMRRAQAVACRSWLAGLRYGNGSNGQRNRHRLVPASSGARAPLACEGRELVGCARASSLGCRSRRAAPRLQETWPTLATGTWTESNLQRSEKGPYGRNGVENRHRGG